MKTDTRCEKTSRASNRVGMALEQKKRSLWVNNSKTLAVTEGMRAARGEKMTKEDPLASRTKLRDEKGLPRDVPEKKSVVCGM